MIALENILHEALKSKKQIIRNNKTNRKNIETSVEGKYLTNRENNVFCSKSYFKLKNKIGDTQLSRFNIQHIIKIMAGFDPVINLKTNDLLFIDTETTGLSTGTGTLAFLIGLGYFSGNEFIVEQFFLSDPSGESVQLNSLINKIRQFHTIVSFNGKSYDIPLLQTRLTLNKMDFNIKSMNHIDLLHLSRKLWKNELESCTLQNLERVVLKIHRDQANDVLGSAIPQIYFNYLQTKDDSDIKNIFYHNKIDVLSMVILMQKISEILGAGYQINQENLQLHKAKAKLYHDLAEYEKAIDIYETCLTIHANDLFVIKHLSQLYKRLKLYSKAQYLWQKAAAQNEIYAFIELSKMYEHIEKDFPVALDWSQKALSCVESKGAKENHQIPEILHRINRLKQKLDRES